MTLTPQMRLLCHWEYTKGAALVFLTDKRTKEIRYWVLSPSIRISALVECSLNLLLGTRAIKRQQMNKHVSHDAWWTGHSLNSRHTTLGWYSYAVPSWISWIQDELKTRRESTSRWLSGAPARRCWTDSSETERSTRPCLWWDPACTGARKGKPKTWQAKLFLSVVTPMFHLSKNRALPGAQIN